MPGVREIDQDDAPNDEFGVVRGDIDQLLENEGNPQRAFEDKRRVDSWVIEFGQSSRSKLRHFGRVTSRALVGLFHELCSDMVQGPFFGIDDVFESVSIDSVRTSHHPKKDWVGTEVSHA